MLKKRIAIFLVLFATILLLAHAFVPHHHHQNHICLSAHYCKADCRDHQHGLPVDEHSHNSQSDSGLCVLKQAVFIPSHQNYFDKHWPGSDKPFLFLDFQAIVSENEWELKGPGIGRSLPECTAPFIFYPFTVSSSGLRAPPVV